MSEGKIFCTVTLEPFYQSFLREQYNQQERLIFDFPKNDDLRRWIEHSVTPPPDDFKPQVNKEDTFHIIIPYMEHKDPRTYNYLSRKKNVHFARRVRELFQMVMHRAIHLQTRDGLRKEEIIDNIMEDFNFLPENRDRIEREYSRYLQRIYNQRFQKKRKKSSQLTE